jgi:hypothetical protein
MEFTGNYETTVSATAIDLYAAASDPMNLPKWVSNQFDNVRPVEGNELVLGARFEADEPLAMSDAETGQLYEVIAARPPEHLALRCVLGPSYQAALTLRPTVEGTVVHWTFTVEPAGLFDRVMSRLIRTKVHSDCQRQARRQVERLVALAVERGAARR